MNILKQWRMWLRAARDLFAALGVLVTLTLYAGYVRGWWFAPVTLVLAAGWWAAYRLRMALSVHRRFRMAGRVQGRLLVPEKLAGGAPPMRRVFVRFDPETGKEITKLEPVPWN